MLLRGFARLFHLNVPCWATEKSQLATLRKKTGYTFSNCKKALEMHNNDLVKAEIWLQEQAQQLGWTKATKLEGRQTTQGLIGVAVHNSNAALIELNCETDFVARNDKFKDMVEVATNACLKFAENQPQAKGPLTKIGMDSEQLKNLSAVDGKLLSDHLALMIGSLGENAMLRRALCLKAEDDVVLSAYAHPSGTQKNNIMMGRFAGLVALKQTVPSEIELDKIGRDVCQHIVGMDPKKIGTTSDEAATNNDDEVCLIHQEYLLDPSVTVNDVLLENGLEVIDFKRFECGENLNVYREHPLELVETCQ